MSDDEFWQKVYIASVQSRVVAGAAMRADLALREYRARKLQGDFRKQNKAL